MKEQADKPAASSSKSSGSNSASQRSDAASSSSSQKMGGDRAFTEEQEIGAKKILALAKKGHYEVYHLLLRFVWLVYDMNAA